VLYTRGVIIQMLGVEAVRRAQERFGKGKVMTGEQVRWGLENLALDQKRLDAAGLRRRDAPDQHLCSDHMGSTWARVHTWDGSKWKFSSDWYQADEQIIKPMVKAGAEKYLADKKMTRRTAADCQSRRTAPTSRQLKGPPAGLFNWLRDTLPEPLPFARAGRACPSRACRRGFDRLSPNGVCPEQEQ
jgi:hypothetical protein